MSETQSSVAQLKSIPVGTYTPFVGLFLIKKITVRTARNGSEFLTVDASDSTGSFSFNAFGGTMVFQTCKGLAEGAVVRLEGVTDHYQNKLSPKVSQAQVLSTQEVEESGILNSLIESCLEDPQDLWNELEGFIQSIEHPELQATVRYVFDEIGPVFRYSAAAIAMHHAYRNGLLEHTVHVTRVAKALLPLYPEINHDLAIAGALLHDVGKTIEYDTQLAVKKTRTGILQGHVVLGYKLARKAALMAKLAPSILERLEHIILSHQGELEWGAAVMAATPEAVFVSMIDNLDAKMGVVQYALRNPSSEREFSDYSPALKSSILTTPVG